MCEGLARIQVPWDTSARSFTSRASLRRLSKNVNVMQMCSYLSIMDRSSAADV